MTGATLFLVGWIGVSVIVLGILGARAERRAGGRHAARPAEKAPGACPALAVRPRASSRAICAPGRSAARHSSCSRLSAFCGWSRPAG
jgi:hypothetical protein